MSYENIRLTEPNFCIGPIVGTFCSVNLRETGTYLLIKNYTGNIINEISFPYTLTNEFVGIEYVGPKNLNNIYDNLPFFILERDIDDNFFIISYFILDFSSLILKLKKKFVYSNTESNSYKATTFSVDSYNYRLIDHIPKGQSVLKLSNTKGLVIGDKILLGPSSSKNNNVTEFVTVSVVDDDTVYINEDVNNTYLIGDNISFCKNIYLISSIGYDNNINQGTIYNISPITGKILNFDTSVLYKQIKLTRWCNELNAIGAIYNTNLIFISPSDYYINKRSIFTNNINRSNVVLEIYDIVFDGLSFYKLIDFTFIYNDVGEEIIYEHDDYNYNASTLLPFTNKVNLSVKNKLFLGGNKRTSIDVKVIDQYGVGLKDVSVRFYIETSSDHDVDGSFDPPTAYEVTDSNGEVSIDYISGMHYDGLTGINCRCDKGSNTTGSEYVWGSGFINSIIDYSPNNVFIDVYSDIVFNTLINRYKSLHETQLFITNKVYFDNRFGDTDKIHTYLDDPIANIIMVLDNNFTHTIDAPRSKECSYNLVHKLESGSLNFSQLKMSRHSYIINNINYDDLIISNSIDQFIFVVDAVPKFYSYKNYRETDIWLRLRPFAHSLDADSLRLYISYTYNNIYYRDIEKEVNINYFDAGSGLLGLELNYTNDILFDYGSFVYVFIEVYDVSYNRNYINLNYWFNVIPDYKSPYITSIIPDINNLIMVDSKLQIDIKDDGIGIDITTLEVYLNSLLLTVNEIVKFSANYFRIVLDLEGLLYYSKSYMLQIIVNDLSENKNRLNSRHLFSTVDSNHNIVINGKPKICDRSVERFSDVELLILDGGDGINKDSIVLQVANKSIDNNLNIKPIIYRII